jgi:hypothetical protein
MSVKQQVLLSESVAKVVEEQVASGRYATVSAALQDAAYNYFIGSPSIFQEYKVTPEEVEASAQSDLAKIRRARKSGGLKTWE